MCLYLCFSCEVPSLFVLCLYSPSTCCSQQRNFCLYKKMIFDHLILNESLHDRIVKRQHSADKNDQSSFLLPWLWILNKCSSVDFSKHKQISLSQIKKESKEIRRKVKAKELNKNEMLRRSFVKRCPSVNVPFFKTTSFHSGFEDPTKGAFSADTEAEKLGIHPRFAQGLLMKADQSFKVKGRRYPSMFGRTSRPGSKSCSKKTMFPMYCPGPEVTYALDKSKRKLTNK